MDPVTTAIVAALVAGSKDVIQQGVLDAYQGLKTLLKRKFGAESDLVDAVESLERKPDSGGRREIVKEEVTAAGAADDAEILTATEVLLEQLKLQPGGERHIMIAQGSFIAQADRSSAAAVHVEGRVIDDD